MIEIIGYEDDFGVDVEIIIRKHHIRHLFPAEVLEEAQAISPVLPQRNWNIAMTTAICPS